MASIKLKCVVTTGPLGNFTPSKKMIKINFYCVISNLLCSKVVIYFLVIEYSNKGLAVK